MCVRVRAYIYIYACMYNKLGKEFFRLLKKNFPLSSNLCKIFNKNNVKLSYSCMPNVANLFNNSNAKKLRNNQRAEPLNATV